MTLSAPVIDIHAHILPECFRTALASAGFYDALGRPLGDGSPLPPWSLDDLLRVMDRNNVAASALSISSPGVTFLGKERARDLARRLNDQLQDIIRARPTRFGAFAVLPLTDVDATLAEIHYALDIACLDGIGLLSNVGGKYLGDRHFEPILSELNRRQTTVFIHPSVPPHFDSYSVNLSAPVLEYPFDSTRTIASLLHSGALARYPNIRMVIPHGGGTIPYLAARITRAASGRSLPDYSVSLEKATALLKNLYFDLTAMGHPDTLQLLRSFMPAANLLVGYDYPFRSEQTIKDHNAHFDAFEGFTEQQKSGIRYGNALRLLPKLAERFDQ